MRIHIWDFIIRYCQKALRMTREELERLDKFMEDFIGPKTRYHNCKGEVIVWSAATLYFFSCLFLRGREPFEITLDRI
jgi:hypothetical protein